MNMMNSHGGHGGHVSISLASSNWEHVKSHLVITLFIIASGLAKLCFHKAHWLSSRLPESCLLIILGVAFGGLLHLNGMDGMENDRVLPDFTSDIFFLYLLPPIILEASWSLYNKNFFSNIRAILLLAVVGTVLNFLLIGALLVAVVKLELTTYDITPIQTFLFASLISAVDPVAVLSIFTEVGVNPHLYFLVFGESLLNDGVAVVLYKMMTTFTSMEHMKLDVSIGDIGLGCLSFLTIAFGGLAVGVVYGLLTSIVTRFTQDVRIIEPLALFCGGYLAYISAEAVHWSGIISLIGCGLTQAHYAFKNISTESKTTVNYFIKMLSSTSDCIIFLYLGIAWFSNKLVWDTGFVLWTIFFCLIVRFLITYILSLAINWVRGGIHPISASEMFVMAYGGLRGAVGFSLVITIAKDEVGEPVFDMLVTTTLVVVMQTVFLQGSTIKWLVNKLQIEKDSETNSLMLDTNNRLFEHIMSYIECVSGKNGHHYYQDKFVSLDEKYLKKIFCAPEAEHDMLSLLSSLPSLTDHYFNLYGPSIVSGQDLSRSQSGYDNPLLEDDSGKTRVININDEESKLQARNSLKKGLAYDPVNKFHAVVDKSLIRTKDRDMVHHLKLRRDTTRRLRRRVLTDAQHSPDNERIQRKSMSMKEPRRKESNEEDLDEVGRMKRIHDEFRRKKVATGSMRTNVREGQLKRSESTGL